MKPGMFSMQGSLNVPFTIKLKKQDCICETSGTWYGVSHYSQFNTYEDITNVKRGKYNLHMIEMIVRNLVRQLPFVLITGIMTDDSE